MADQTYAELYEELIREPKPPGLLSLMYWVKHDRRYWVAFHLNPLGTMNDFFGIPANNPNDSNDHRARLAVEIGNIHDAGGNPRPKMMELFEPYLNDEILGPGGTWPYW